MTGRDHGPMEGGDPGAQRIAELARTHYNRPPEVPAHEMWARVQAEIERRPDVPGVVPIRRTERLAWPRAAAWAAAASVVLALGVGLGRWSAPGLGEPATVGTGVAVEARVASAEPGVALLTARHLESTESLFSLVRADAHAGTIDRDVGRWGRTLLLETRMLLDAGGAEHPVLGELLLDLEVLLAQVALLDTTVSPERAREELDLILRGLDNQSMMARIQSALPAVGQGLSGT